MESMRGILLSRQGAEEGMPFISYSAPYRSQTSAPGRIAQTTYLYLRAFTPSWYICLLPPRMRRRVREPQGKALEVPAKSLPSRLSTQKPAQLCQKLPRLNPSEQQRKASRQSNPPPHPHNNQHLSQRDETLVCNTTRHLKKTRAL